MARAYDFSISHTSRHNDGAYSFQDSISIELCWCCVEFGRGDLCATLLGNQTSLFWRDWFMDLNPLSVALDGRHLPSHQSPTSGVMHSCYCIFLFLFFKRLLIVVIIKNNSPYVSYAYKHILSLSKRIFNSCDCHLCLSLWEWLCLVQGFWLFSKVTLYLFPLDHWSWSIVILRQFFTLI